VVDRVVDATLVDAVQLPGHENTICRGATCGGGGDKINVQNVSVSWSNQPPNPKVQLQGQCHISGEICIITT